MSKKLYIGSLAWATNSDGLKVAFGSFGEIEEAIVITDRETGHSRGFGFVTFQSEEEAEKALEMDGAELDGRRLKVSLARERTERNDNRGGGDRW